MNCKHVVHRGSVLTAACIYQSKHVHHVCVFLTVRLTYECKNAVYHVSVPTATCIYQGKHIVHHVRAFVAITLRNDKHILYYF